MESPMTTECEALRQEVELLAAENRRLINELNELRKTPAYLEKAVRAVWEKGFGHREALSWKESKEHAWPHYADEVSRIFVEALRDA